MTLYTVENTAKAGTPCRVFDGCDEEVCDVIECDDVTGRVVRLARDLHGKYKVHPQFRDIERLVEIRPLPLRIQWDEM